VLPVVLAAVFSAIGFRTFVIAWMKSGIMASVAGVLGLPISLLVPAVGLFGAVCAFYAFWRLARWIDRSIGQFLAEPDDNTFRNLKTNGYFLLSAALFFIMENTRTDLFPLGIPVAVLVFAMVAGKIPSLWKMTLDTHPGIRVLSALNALGICWSELFVFRKYWHLTGGERAIPADIWLTAAAVASFPFVYICVALFWRWLWKQIRAGLQQLCRWERGAIVGLMVILMVLTLFAFTRSDAYYGTEFPYDILYTSDSHILVENNTYLSLGFEENDLRQPLFAVFSAPFMGIATLVSRMFSLSATGNAIVMNWVQIAVLVLTLVLLSEKLELTGKKRIGFLLLAAVGYPVLLFSLMMEQYIFTFFYVVLALYLSANVPASRAAVWGAGGTLLTSVVLLPAGCESNPVKQFSRWFTELLNHAIEFVFLMLAFCRLDIILDAAYSLEKLSRFSENTLTWPERIYRFTQFVRSCIFAPPVDSLHNPNGVLSWQLIPAAGMDWIGVAILVLCIISAAMNWKKASARAAAFWMGFSVVVLLILGWGAPENGQILYSLYFGWAFFVLLYQLADRIGTLCRKPVLSTILTVLLFALMAFVNIPAIWEMIRFATAVFPL